MLIWRLIIGTLLVLGVGTLAWLDLRAGASDDFGRPGAVLAPLALLASVLAGGELVRLFENNAKLDEANRSVPRTQALAPSRYVVSSGAFVALLISCAPLLWRHYPEPCIVGRAGWVGIGVAVASLAAFLLEMIRYQAPGVATVRLAQSVFGIVYAGGLFGFVAQLRALGGPPWGDDGRWGMVALVSLIAVVKGNDIGAYTAGRLFGRTKMTPTLSPGKTWEGFAGGTAMSVVAAAACLGPLAAWVVGDTVGDTLGDAVVYDGGWLLRTIGYGIAVGLMGVAGDLGISLLKRDAGVKNSSRWLPGLGGILDVFDSILFAAPVAYVLWAARVVGP